MPTSQYATRSDSVLAWKKANKLGRFDPHTGDAEALKKEAAEREIRERGQCPLSYSTTLVFDVLFFTFLASVQLQHGFLHLFYTPPESSISVLPLLSSLAAAGSTTNATTLKEPFRHDSF